MKRVTKEEAKGGKSDHTVRMMLDKEHHKKVGNWTTAKVARDFKRESLRNTLLITVSGDREKAAIWRLHECEVRGQTIGLQPISVRMTCDDALEWLGEEVLQGGETRRPLTGNLSGTPLEPKSAKVSTMMTTRTNQLRPPSAPSWPTICSKEATGEAGSPSSSVRRRGKRGRPAKLAIHHCPLGISSELTLRAALSATGGTPPSNRTTSRGARPRRRKQRGRRRHMG